MCMAAGWILCHEGGQFLLAQFGIVLITASTATNVNIASSSQILSQDCKEHEMTLKILSFK